MRLSIERFGLCAFLAGLLSLGFPARGVAEENTEVVYTSPSGVWRVEQSGNDVWVVSTKDTSQRAKLPPIDAIGPYPDADMLGSFNHEAWGSSVKLGVLKENSLGAYAMMFFIAWSSDSGRLLIKLYGGEEKRSMKSGLLYFNTRTKKFEVTDYLRKLNKTKANVLPCAEPVDPLPSEAELKTRFDTLDGQLNEKYAKVLARTEKDRVPLMREAQRTWIKHRDEGAKLYTSIFPAAEKEKRRLQFLGDVTAARIDTPGEEWEVER